MSNLKNAKVCYGCGEKWEHANKHNHYCTLCRYENRNTLQTLVKEKHPDDE